MSSTKSGKEIVECHLVGQVDDREARTPPETVAVEEVVVANGKIEEITGAIRGGLWSSFSVPGAGILCIWNRIVMQGTGSVRERTNRSVRRSKNVSAEESRLELQVRRQSRRIHDGDRPIAQFPPAHGTPPATRPLS